MDPVIPGSGILLIAVIVWLIRRNQENYDHSEKSDGPPQGAQTGPATRQSVAPGVQTSTHAPPPPIPDSREIVGKAYVIDGDTIVINKVKVRLAGIDAPELDRPWGQKSKWEMVRICKGQSIRVELTGETSYDRLVGTCYLPDGRDIGGEIVKAGLALDGGYYSEGKYRHLEPAGIRRKIRPFGNKGRPRS
ncbi:thermonuclease family protein [Sulfitobacter sp. S190]|nr:thermonuclease family protein [Sulfitobacter sp. S190]